MGLKQADQARLDTIKGVFEAMSDQGLEIDLIKSTLGSQLDSFEQDTGHKINLGADGSIECIDLSKDFVRTRKPNEQNLVLKARIEGVPIEVKIAKEGKFSFSNDRIAQSLSLLSLKMKALVFEVSILEGPYVST